LSNIRADEISDAAGTGPITLTKQSAAKAWCNFDSLTTTVILESFNASSITDNSVGNFDVSLVGSMSSANYAGVCGGFESNANNSIVAVSFHSNNCTASSVRILVNTSSAGAFDAPFNSFSLLGDLA